MKREKFFRVKKVFRLQMILTAELAEIYAEFAVPEPSRTGGP